MNLNEKIKIPIRVLIIEDSNDDKELLLLELIRGGYNPDYIVVETSEELNYALDRQTWDIILSDYSMPNFDGLAALNIIKSREIDIPFIIISGTIGEDVAVNAMRAGAQDYLMKGQLKRLIPAIERELQEAKIRVQRKQAIEDLRQSELKYKRLFENDLTGDFITAVDGTILLCNNSFAKIFGFSSVSEIMKTNISELYLNPQARDIFINLIREKKKAEEYEQQFILRNGKIITVIGNIIGDFNENGDLVQLTGYLFDITTRKNAEEALKESEKKFRSVWEKSTDGMRITNEEGIALLVNDSYCKLFKKSHDEIEGKPMSAVYQESRRDYILEKHQQRFRARVIPEHIEREIIIWNGEKLHLDLSNTFLNIANQPTVSLSVFRDITERKQFEKEIIQSKEKAEESEKLKTEFLAQMSHEIRTPLNIIISNSSYLKQELKESLNENFQFCFTSMDIASKRIIRTVDLILNMSEIQTGSFNLWKNNVDLVSQIITPLVKEHSILAKNKNINFNFKSIANNSTLYCDEYCVTQIIANLIDNAIKYTSKGNVEVSLFENEKAQLVLEVSDTGEGMSKTFLSKLFEPFVQEEQGYKRKFDGNGLGLALVKKYCDLSNAEIVVESSKNVGTKFCVIFNR
ncbi:MAG: PAS domain S-box protein [Bacteroidetes bacterium]|nr:PAS domain S-box protein [Bacteroidota bacterium]